MLDRDMLPRVAALETLRLVILDGQSLARALPRVLASVSSPADRALARELVYGVTRWHLRLAAIVARLLSRPLKRKDRDVGLLIEIGLYQLIYQRTPSYAAVDAAVETAGLTGRPWAAGLINATLRGFLRDSEAIVAQVDADDGARLAHPPWLLSRLQRAYPHLWQQLCAAANERPPMTLRVNLARLTRERYAAMLADASIDSAPVEHVESALTLGAPVDVERLPGFADGLASVQDAAAQLAAPLLAADPGMRVLDACAAPGGKTAHLLERADGRLDLEAVELDSRRMERVRTNLERLHLAASLIAADAACPASWWSGQPYDRILLDAPCSATGVIRRNPDIKIHRSEADVTALMAGQRRLLHALWPLLRPGGILLYATCSILPEENDANIEAFLREEESARHDPIEAAWGEPRNYGRQLLPGSSGMDGFYYARLVKR